MEAQIGVDRQLNRIVKTNDGDATIQVVTVPIVHLCVKNDLKRTKSPRGQGTHAFVPKNASASSIRTVPDTSFGSSSSRNTPRLRDCTRSLGIDSINDPRC